MEIPSRKWTRVVAGVVLAGWVVVIYLAVSSPTTPELSSGHTVPISNHGTIHYATKLVNFLLLWYIPIFLVAASVLKGRRWLKRRGRV